MDNHVSSLWTPWFPGGIGPGQADGTKKAQPKGRTFSIFIDSAVVESILTEALRRLGQDWLIVPNGQRSICYRNRLGQVALVFVVLVTIFIFAIFIVAFAVVIMVVVISVMIVTVVIVFVFELAAERGTFVQSA